MHHGTLEWQGAEKKQNTKFKKGARRQRSRATREASYDTDIIYKYINKLEYKY